MRALIVRHTDYEGAAGFRQPIEAAGYAFSRIDVLDPAFGEADFMAPDLLVLMGGPMGVYERDRHSWINGEVARIAARLEARLPTIGICLGSQLIAAALGAAVYPGPVQEIGFGPVTIGPEGMASPVRHLAGTPVLHWHGDTFDLPEGCELLASSALYQHQAYRRGKRLLALQCHPEMGEDPRFTRWIDDGAADLAAAGTDAATVRADYAALGPPAVAAGRAMLTEWLAGLR
ncbi:glutamine amidotransferase [Sphingomonas prati]|uniref:GMP synthase (Glutamine-hydrolyzing) n=1 Tax=Sphingomonas prati TaxID=1843237 RepID=A0A7W9F4A8_9SPHN|nr:glutamine amidotransferase [Sphingomonas prati]MBB5730729.1 GMP synthase (glutamine-hydrolyzing) [Sphingomonas prati]GGE95681.1 GMP synthase [Sphingomonas prati]